MLFLVESYEKILTETLPFIDTDDLHWVIADKTQQLIMEITVRKSVLKTLLTFLFLVVGCNPASKTEKNITFAEVATPKQGTLILMANGESFVRDGFVTKDGWEVDFTKLTVSVSNIVAYQTETNFDPDQDDVINSKLVIPLVEEPKVIDLTQESALQNLTFINKMTVPIGSYQAISWEMVPTNDPGKEAQTIFLQGSALKDGKKIDFELGISLPVKYLCGEFVGEKRKGIVTDDKSTELEITFHFDHLFGDGDLAANDALNLEALGFQPLAKLAQAGSLKLDWQAIQQKLEPTELKILTKAIAGLGHVGEGHCRTEKR